ncbi:MAG TPA: ankyrin repeat domain-containing protein [Thermoanaerobaculia bacterium]|nr:ankyrin repeat domain-containing protein [Thermoanaerobaculia bacterium]
MNRSRFAAALFLGAFAIAASAEDGPLFKIYKQYQHAIAKDDLAAAKKLVSSGKREQLELMEEREALASLDVLSPKEKLRSYKEIVDGEDATLIVLALVAENESVGRIQFAREEGTWRILSELWDIGGDPDASPVKEDDIPKPKNDEQRAAIRKLREKGYPAPSAEFLVMTAAGGDLETLKLFVQAGYSVDSKSSGSPAIVSAAMFDHPHIVMYLIEAGADVNAVDDVNTTALMRMAEKCEAVEAVEALLKAGAKLDVKSRGGATALDLAGYSQCSDNAAAIEAAMKKR